MFDMAPVLLSFFVLSLVSACDSHTLQLIPNGKRFANIEGDIEGGGVAS